MLHLVGCSNGLQVEYTKRIRNAGRRLEESRGRMKVQKESQNSTNYSLKLLDALVKNGWEPEVVPSRGEIKSNRQIVEFRTPAARLRARFSIFAVGDRGESHRRDERRIQITTTYLSGLERLGNAIDIVLGYDRAKNVYVGLDPRRLEYGGEKHNASSSVAPEALDKASRDHIVLQPHDTQILGLEYQAVIHPERLTEYIFNIGSIHRGQYFGNGQFSDSPGRSAKRNVSLATVKRQGQAVILRTSWVSHPKELTKSSWIEWYESGDLDKIADLTPEEFEALRRKCGEIGDRGEYFVIRFEKQRLRKAGRADLAARIDWVSRRAIGRGYDIKSFEIDGKPRLIEVKSTVSQGLIFFISDQEWSVASKERSAYYIYRVINVAKEPLIHRILQDPVAAEEKQIIKRTAYGWKVLLKKES